MPETVPVQKAGERSHRSIGSAAVRSKARVWGWSGILLLLVGIGLALVRFHHFGDVSAFHADLRSVSLSDLFLGVLCIHLGLVVRAYRWALLMNPGNRPAGRTLITPQFVGFAAVSCFGRVADLARPYLVAKRTQTPTAEQIGVYTVERALDIAATAVLFSVTLLFVPQSSPHHHAFLRAGLLASVATAILLGFASVLRFAGHRFAAWVRAHLGGRFPGFAEALAGRLLELQAGFRNLHSGLQFCGAFAWSLLIWFGIALSYLLSAHSLRAIPELTVLGLASIMLIMATSMGTSLLQLPVLGWITQVAALGAAYHGFFGVPAAAASLCGLLTFAVNTLSVIPVGFIFARVSGLSLGEARRPALEPVG